MAFFGSKSYERALKRTPSTDRLRHTHSSSAASHASTQRSVPATDEFGVLPNKRKAELAHPTPAATSSALYVPDAAARPSSSSSSLNMPSMRTRTVSGSGSGSGNGSGSGTNSRRTSHSPNPSRKRGTDATATESPRVRLNSGASGSAGRKAEAVARARSSPDLKVEKGAPRVRSKSSLRAQPAASDTSAPGSAPSSVSGRPPRGPRPPDMQPAVRSTPFPSSSTTQNPNPSHSPASHSISSSSSSPLSLPGSNGASFRKQPLPPSPSASRHDTTLTIPSNPNSISKSGKSSGGNVSDGSYGSPLSELGIGFSVKRLLSKPAASSASASASIGLGSGVRSEPDTNTDYLGGSYGLGSRRRGGLETGHTPDSPSVYSMTGLSASLREHARKPTTSDPEMPRTTLGSLGRARGLEWGHVLGRDRENVQAHAREDSTLSASSPSEGAAYPYGLALERERERRVTKGPRPLIQLTTSAVRRLSALGAREADRDRPPHTPMSFGAAQTSSPLTGTRVRARPSCSPQPSSSSSATTATASVLPVGLTPAEIVAHSYKEQERRRAELERDAAQDAATPEKLHTGGGAGESSREAETQRTVRIRNKERVSLLTRRASADATSSLANTVRKGDGSPAGETPGPYYTVFGEPTGRVVAIGSARDSAWGLFGQESKAKATEQAVVAEISMAAASTTISGVDEVHHGAAAATISGPGGSGSKTLRRKLSRKMSGKFRREGSLARSGGKEGGSEGKDEFGDVLSGGEDGGYGTDGHGHGPLRGRPSLSLNTSSSGRKSATLPREKGASGPLKISMDSFVAVHRTESVSGRTLPSAANGSSTSPRAFIPGGWVDGGGKARLRNERERVGEREGEKEREKEKEKGKLWGLVKRISSNTLKDKYRRSSAEVVPPVPAIPRDYSRASASPTFEGDGSGSREEEGEGEEGRRRRRERLDSTTSGKLRLDTRVSPAHSRRPSTAPVLSAVESGKEGRFATLRKKPSASAVQTLGPSPIENPSSATTHSTVSSGVVSSLKGYERSSVSSLGDLISSDGKEMLGQHILPPETLYMFDDFNLNFDVRKEDAVVSKPVSRDSRGSSGGRGSLFYGEESEPASHQALPVPPRRVAQNKLDHDDDDLRSDSPTIPSFSADNAINTFGFRNRSGTNTGASVASAFTGADFGLREASASPSLSPATSLKTSSEPPPRPPRSSRRAAPSILHSQSSHGSHSPSPSLARTIFEDRISRASLGAHSQASTARPSVSRSPSSSPSPPPELLDSQSPVSASDSASSTMTFRDISGMASKPSWSEKEKVDKWNDLLDRSEKAGGTLHVGVGGLLSDHIRDSAYEPVRDSAFLGF